MYTYIKVIWSDFVWVCPSQTGHVNCSVPNIRVSFVLNSWRCETQVGCNFDLPEGPPQCRSVRPVWRTPPPWRSCSRRSPHPRAAAAAGTGSRAAGPLSSRGTCRSPTWWGPPMLHASHTAGGRHKSLLSGLMLNLSESIILMLKCS